MLLLARDEDGEPMTDHELRDELVTLLVAGHETTATGLAWAFELLLRNPRVLERLRAELADGRRRLPRRGRQGDAAPAARRPGRRPRRARRALRARRLPDPAGRRDQPVDRGHPPAARPLPATPRRVPPRALPRRRRARHLHVAAVRRRHAALPGRELRHFEMRVVIRRVLERPASGGRPPPRKGPCARASRSCRNAAHARSRPRRRGLHRHRSSRS